MGEGGSVTVDRQQYQIIPLSSVQVTLPRARIQCLVTDSMTGATIADLTSTNAIVFPAVIADLDAASRRDLIDVVASFLIDWKLKQLGVGG